MSDPCSCGMKKAIILSVSLSRDDVPCGRCGKSISIDSIKAPRDVAHLLRRWVDQAFAIEMLWFSSAEYEPWAKGELDSPRSRLNVLGLQVAQKLNPSVETWLFSAPHAAARQAVDRYLDHCPFCHEPTQPTGLIAKYGLGCASCRSAGSAE